MKSLAALALVFSLFAGGQAVAQTSEASSGAERQVQGDGSGSSDIPSFDGLPASVDSGQGGTPLRDAGGQPTSDIVPDASVVDITGLPQAPSDLVPVQYGQNNGFVDRSALSPITQVYQQPDLYEVPSLNVFLMRGTSPIQVPSDQLAGILPTDDGRTSVLLGDPQRGYQQGWTDTSLTPLGRDTIADLGGDQRRAGSPGFDDLSLSNANGPATPSTREFKVLATSFIADKTASGEKINPRAPLDLVGVALPSRSPLGRTIRIRLANQQTWYTAAVIDVGPWNTKDNYWDRDGVPKAATGQQDDFGRKPTNPAGIDLTFGLWYRLLGLSGGLTPENRATLKNVSGDVVWCFAP